jgi:hypothetical protein
MPVRFCPVSIFNTICSYRGLPLYHLGSTPHWKVRADTDSRSARISSTAAAEEAPPPCWARFELLHQFCKGPPLTSTTDPPRDTNCHPLHRPHLLLLAAPVSLEHCPTAMPLGRLSQSLTAASRQGHHGPPSWSPPNPPNPQPPLQQPWWGLVRVPDSGSAMEEGACGTLWFPWWC